MTTFFRILLIASVYLFSIVASAEDIDPSKLIKVDADNQEKCVEYFKYNKELYCSTTKLSKEPLDPKLKDNEKLEIVFDKRPWRLAWGKKDDDSSTLEYVSNNEKVEDWSELITSQFFPGIQDKGTLEDFAETFIYQFKKDGYDPKVTYHEKSDDQIIFELQIPQPKNQIQDILILMMKDENGLYVLQYAIKKFDMGKEARDLWVDNFKETEIKS